jgi:hypothetical protein
MHSAQALELETKTLYEGRVIVLCDGDYICEGKGRRFKAKKAHSCALIPQIGDTVLLFQSDRSFYILNILERGPVKHHLYHFPGHSAFMMEESFIQSCSEYKLQAKDYYLQSDRIGLESKRLWTQIDFASVKAKTLDIKTTLLRRQAQRFYNCIEQFEHKVAGRIRTIVKHCFRLDTEEARVYAKGAIKMDGDGIHLG